MQKGHTETRNFGRFPLLPFHWSKASRLWWKVWKLCNGNCANVRQRVSTVSIAFVLAEFDKYQRLEQQLRNKEAGTGEDNASGKVLEPHGQISRGAIAALAMEKTCRVFLGARLELATCSRHEVFCPVCGCMAAMGRHKLQGRAWMGAHAVRRPVVCGSVCIWDPQYYAYMFLPGGKGFLIDL